MSAQALSIVFKHVELSWGDLANVSSVCKEYRQAVQSPELWQSINLSGRQDAAQFLLRASKAPQFKRWLRILNLEFAAGVEDKHTNEFCNFDLHEINLNGCQRLTQAAVTRLISGMQDLVHLELYWVLNIGDEALMSMAAYNEKLAYLSLSGCRNVTDQGLRVLLGGCQGLKHLNLTRCLNIASRGLEAVGRDALLLQTLNLYACSQVTDSCLVAFSSLQHLEYISLTGSVLLTDTGLAALARCYRLRHVELSWCIRLTDKGVCALAEGCKALEVLSLHGILGVTDASIEALAESCRQTIHSLDVNGCTGIKRGDKAQLKQSFPCLRVFVIHT